MATFMLIHRHEARRCAAAYSAWNGVESELRGAAVYATCARVSPPSNGGLELEHEIWWTVEAADATAALAELPPFIAERTQAREVSRVAIP